MDKKELKRPKGLGMATGISLGAGIGIILDNLAIGIAVGVAMGAGFEFINFKKTMRTERIVLLILAPFLAAL